MDECVPYHTVSDSAENVVFLELPGTGKTHLATVLGKEERKHRFLIYCINCHTLIEQLKKAHVGRGVC